MCTLNEYFLDLFVNRISLANIVKTTQKAFVVVVRSVVKSIGNTKESNCLPEKCNIYNFSFSIFCCSTSIVQGEI